VREAAVGTPCLMTSTSSSRWAGGSMLPSSCCRMGGWLPAAVLPACMRA
jgi:hypothetical protein